MSTAALVRVVFVDCCPEVLAAVGRGLDAGHGIEVMALLGTPTHVERVCRVVRPDVVVLDPTMPGLDAAALTSRLAEVSPESKVLVHAVAMAPDEFDRVMEAGVWGATYRGWDVESLGRAIRRVHSGEFVLNIALRPPVAVGEAAPAAGREAECRGLEPQPGEGPARLPTGGDASSRGTPGGWQRTRTPRLSAPTA
ncbi:MAG TPA: hypothetical protein VD997_17400 [Phycisphaerales bacterium]|nr:hypothetical protein [Phycisphaerales bacterium]